MDVTKRKIHAEGIVIIGIGIFFTVLALLVPKNPVVLDGWLNVLAQAKTVPLVTGILMVLFGLKFTIEMYIGKTKPTTVGINDKLHAAIVLGINLLYLVAIIYFGFKIPTAIYLITLLIYLNRRKSRPLKIAGAILLFYLVSMILMPMMLSLRLP